jgi:hypothetical protein
MKSADHQFALLSTLAAAAAVFLISLPTGAQSGKAPLDQSFRMRMDTIVDNVVGLGDEAPSARIVLHIEEDDLCLFIAIPPAPTQLQAELFKFKRRIEGERQLETLKFRLPKPTKRDDGARIWDTCLEESVGEDLPLDRFGSVFLDITYRDPRGYRGPVETTMDHPLRRRATGLDVYKDSAGTIQFYNYNPPVAEES